MRRSRFTPSRSDECIFYLSCRHWVHQMSYSFDHAADNISPLYALHYVLLALMWKHMHERPSPDPPHNLLT